MLLPAPEYYEWLEEPPDYLLEDDMDEELEAWKKTSGLKPGAPQSAIDAFNADKKMMARVEKERAEQLQECLSKAADRCLKCFVDYLDKPDDSRKEKAIADIGLVKNAPRDAVKAYKEYQEIMKAAKEHGIKL